MDTDSKLDRSLDDLAEESRGRSGYRGRGRGRSGRGRGRSQNRDHPEASTEPIRVARRIYVSNLSWKTSWQDLKDHFKKVGTVVYADVLRGDDNRSKGCGIVEFDNAQEAADAINDLHLTELDGRQVFVREDREDYELRGTEESRPQKERQPRSNNPGFKIFVGNLSYKTTWQSLKDHFNTDGNVTYANVPNDSSGRSRGFGLVEFTTEEGAQAAIENLNNSSLDGREIFVREDQDINARSNKQ